MTPSDIFIAPFAEFAFMKRALAASLIIALSGAPLGVFMSLRRLTLVGDALSHAILPGVAVAFLVAGLSVWAMTWGGLAAALIVAGLAVLLTRYTQLKEDAAFTVIYLVALALGVTLVSMKGSSAHLLHLLFGDILAIDVQALWFVTGVSALSLFTLAGLYRRLVIEGFDPDFLRIVEGPRGFGKWSQPVFFLLLVVNLVAAFQALGTLMALGLMILPALAARFWAQKIDRIMPVSIFFAAFSAYTGLLLSYHLGVASGPAIVLVAGTLTLVSSVAGSVGSVRTYLRQN